MYNIHKYIIIFLRIKSDGGMMSRAKRRREAPMPMGGAGLIRFFQDESEGIKIGPVTVTILSIALILVVIIAWARSLGLLPFF